MCALVKGGNYASDRHWNARGVFDPFTVNLMDVYTFGPASNPVPVSGVPDGGSTAEMLGSAVAGLALSWRDAGRLSRSAGGLRQPAVQVRGFDPEGKIAWRRPGRREGALRTATLPREEAPP